MLATISMWLLVGMVLCAPRSAHAATGGAGLPWETPLTTLSNSVTGPVARGAVLRVGHRLYHRRQKYSYRIWVRGWSRNHTGTTRYQGILLWLCDA